MLRFLLLALCLASVADRDEPIAKFDTFELNTCPEIVGPGKFHYLICWKWVEEDRSYRVQYYFMAEDPAELMPDRLPGRWRFYFGRHGCVEAENFIRTKTDFDVQYFDRWRRELPDRMQTLPQSGYVPI